MAIPREAERLWTAEDLLALGEEARYELIEGRLVPMSPTGLSHGYMEARIVALLWTYLREHPIGILVTGKVGFVLRRDPDTVRAADIAFIRANRLPPEGLPSGFFEGAPDLAVEILSPFDRYPDLLHKVSQWLEAGTRLVWVVDPVRRTVTAFQPDGTLRLLDESAELDGGDVLPGFRYPVQDLFEGRALSNLLLEAPMREVMEAIERWKGRGERVALATVVKVIGSAPRDVGAKMAVSSGGEMAGSVSGGCVEGAVFEIAQEVLRTGRPRLVRFGISDEMAWDVGLACGGTIEVFIEPLP